MSNALQVVDELSNVVRPELRSAGGLALQELDQGSTCPAFSLGAQGVRYLLLRPDSVLTACGAKGCSGPTTKNDALFPYLKSGASGVTQCCDFIAFCAYKNANESQSLFIVMIELKSGAVSGSRRQLENGRRVGDFLVGVVRDRAKTSFLGLKVEYRGLVFSPKAPRITGDPTRNRCPFMPYHDGDPTLLTILARPQEQHLRYFL